MTAFHRDVEIEIPGVGTMGCYMAVPSKPNGSVLVVLQEIFGINPYIRSVVDGFAEEGFVSIAPDLFWRQQPGVQLDPSSEADRERATMLMKGLDTDLAVADAGRALAFARGQVNEAAPLFAVGYCLGGKLAFLLAAAERVDAAVSYYGVGIHTVLDQAKGITRQVLLHVAEEDHLCPPQAQADIVTGLAPLGERARIILYPGVGHAFARRGGASFNESAARKADQATLAFLRERLNDAE